MSVVRIFQIAKELNISHTDILSFLNKKGVDVKSHMSPVDEEVKNLIMAEFSKDKMLVDRFRKEQVRKEIHDTRLKEKQESQKKASAFKSSRPKETRKRRKT
jgi:translation initiation factor IF-2